MALDGKDDWERLLSAERQIQALIPGTVLVGGTAAALHAGHRTSHDGDHVVGDLRERFDEVLQQLEAAAGWQTARIVPGVQVLGQLHGMLTGIRQLRRTRPLETEVIEGLRVPTLAEMARIKMWLLATRNTVRDLLDSVVLLERLGEGRVRLAFKDFDEIYKQLSGTSPLAEAVERLAAGQPRDGTSALAGYRGLQAPWNEWGYLLARARHWAQALAPVVLEQQ